MKVNIEPNGAGGVLLTDEEGEKHVFKSSVALWNFLTLTEDDLKQLDQRRAFEAERKKAEREMQNFRDERAAQKAAAENLDLETLLALDVKGI